MHLSCRNLYVPPMLPSEASKEGLLGEPDVYAEEFVLKNLLVCVKGQVLLPVDMPNSAG